MNLKMENMSEKTLRLFLSVIYVIIMIIIILVPSTVAVMPDPVELLPFSLSAFVPL